jgi:hypothetical protein
MGRGAFFEMASHISDVRPLPGDSDVKMREREREKCGSLWRYRMLF